MNTTVTRSLSGIIFLAVVIGCLLGGRYCFLILFVFIQVQMLHEFYQIALQERHQGVRVAAILIALASFILVDILNGPRPLSVRWIGLIPVLLVGLMIWMVVRHREFKDYAYVFTGLVYIGLPLALSPFVVNQGGEYSGILMLSFFILIWASDTGAYCFGMLLGQKIWPAKLCPEISPKKSWAGAIGGLAASLLAAWILYRVGWLDFPLVHVLVMAALVNVTGVFGDLFESLWKRQFGVKDSGNILPGHGGLLDRFDSSLFAIPTGYVYLLINGLI